jgi:hypothetical protein
MLHRLRRDERREFLFNARDEDVSALLEARVNARLFAEAQELLAREQRELYVPAR